jgi:hypothetical protein
LATNHASKAIKKTSSLFLVCLMLGSCASPPFVDGRREAGQTRPLGPSNENRVAICYNSRTTNPNEVWKIAKIECSKTNRVPVHDGEDKLDCTVTNPTRVYFKCLTPPLE